MIKTLDDANFAGRNVLVRVDFNVPFGENLTIADDTRIVETLPTIDKIIDDGGIPILMSHLGRPKGEPNLKYSLKPVADYLENHLGYDVLFANDCIGDSAKETIAKAMPGNIVLLENVRFHKDEEKNTDEFASKLAELGDCYVNDAFGSAHRAHASVHNVAKMFEERYAGYLMMKEIQYLGNALDKPIRPFTAVIGGAKVSGKIDVIRSLFEKCDNIIIGGGMTFTFLKALDLEIGNSIIEEDKIALAKELIDEAENHHVKIFLPVDIVIANEFYADSPSTTVHASEIPSGKYGMDIGEGTRKLYDKIISESSTLFWNGPMGVFEMPKFAEGTLAIVKSVIGLTARGGVTIVGGGDSISALKQTHHYKDISHVSTGGGASLEFIEGKVLPGIAVLDV